MQLGSQPAYREPPVSGPNAHHSSRADEFMKHFVARRSDFSLLSFDIQNPGSLKDRIVQLSEAIGSTRSDWEAFRARGGKIIWLQGNDDPSVTPIRTRPCTRGSSRRWVRRPWTGS
jgi:feruloyl esterase